MVKVAKRIVMALLVAFAVSVSASSAASAAPTFAAGAYPVTISGSAAVSFIFEFDGNEVTCESTTFGASLFQSESMLVLTPGVANCIMTGLLATPTVSVQFNKCFWTVAVTKKVKNGEFTHVGTANLECPNGNELVEFVAKVNGTTVCEYTIAPISNLSEVRYGTMEPGGPKDLTMDWLVAGLAYNRRIGAKTFCGSGSNFADYNGNATAKGFNEKGTQVDLEVTGT